jgi:signal transduction histidine kinase
MPLYDDHGEIIGTFGISKNITAFKEAEAQVEELHKQLLQASRQAGMAEVATSVLHNVGNVLNSVNVSATLLLDNAKASHVTYLGKAIALLNEHAADLGAYLANDPKGRHLPGFLSQISEELTQERQCIITELESLRENIEHIKEIVAMQQNYANVSGVVETVKVADLVEDALRMNAGVLARHDVALTRDYAGAPAIRVEKHKVLQVLVNLIRNARHACDESGRKDKQITIKIRQRDQWVCVAVIDNGVGIPPENRTRIFNHGFTTRKDGHGFGLHSGALAATELGGTLTALSDGIGKGATFTLELPLQPPNNDS